MKAVTVWQPWASAIGRVKFIETRSWRTKHRGYLAIHAAVRTPNGYKDYFAAFAQQTAIEDPPVGAVVSIARLVDCVPVEELGERLTELELFWGDYTAGRYGWILEDVRFLEVPAKCSGRQLLWDWDETANG